MGWVHDVPEDDLYEHEGYVVAVLADGSEPEPIEVPVGQGSVTSPNSAWWLYTGKEGRPLAVAVRGGCACGWRSEDTFPVDFEDSETTEGFEFNDGPFGAWQFEHIASLLGTSMPSELREAIGTVARGLRQEAATWPMVALTAIGQLEKLVADVAPVAGRNANQDGRTWAEIGRALGITRQAAHQRFKRYTVARTADGLPIHIGGCTYQHAAHNDRCGCAGLSDPGQPKVPAVRAADAERARHA